MACFCFKSHVKKKSQVTNVKKPFHYCIYYDNTVTSFYESVVEEVYPIQGQSFLGVFIKLRKEAISSLMSVCLSVCPSPTCMEQLSSHWTDFHEI
jgi:hypothetical protein